ncbi:hypothetical protein [Falsiroseomonas bella]|nr:hypothetical protein [Falsiroseomonas bella]
MDDPMAPGRRPPVLDMTPEGEFRDAAPKPAGTLDRILARVGGIAVLVALAAGGLVLAAVAIMFAALALPVLIVAAAVGAGSIWWRLRRARKHGQPVHFVVIRR